MKPAEISALNISIRKIAAAITPNAHSEVDVSDTNVSSLTEAVTGMTAALVQIAVAICDLAEAVREQRD